MNHGLALSFFALGFITLPSTFAASFIFNKYPTCAQPILYAVAPPSCDYGSDISQIRLTNGCLCSSRGFLTDSAAKIYANCGCNDLQTSAQVLTELCALTGTNSVSDVEDYIRTGVGEKNAGQCDPLAKAHDDAKGLDAGAIVGIVFGVVTFVLGVLQFCAMMNWINPSMAPWPHVRKYLCCCI